MNKQLLVAALGAFMGASLVGGVALAFGGDSSVPQAAQYATASAAPVASSLVAVSTTTSAIAAPSTTAPSTTTTAPVVAPSNKPSQASTAVAKATTSTTLVSRTTTTTTDPRTALLDWWTNGGGRVDLAIEHIDMRYICSNRLECEMQLDNAVTTSNDIIPTMKIDRSFYDGYVGITDKMLDAHRVSIARSLNGDTSSATFRQAQQDKATYYSQAVAFVQKYGLTPAN